MIIDSITAEHLKPRRGGNVFATVFVPVDVGLVSQDSCAAFANVGDGEPGADVEADAVVEVRAPADGLFVEWLPAYEDVVGGFAFEDQFQLFLEGFGGSESFLGSVHVACDVLLLAADPVAEVGVDQGFQQLGVEFVVVDQGGEAVAQSIPDVPDEGSMLEQLAVLGEEFIS